MNYSRGDAILQLNVLSKPSSKLLWAQVCMWRNKYSQETCAKRVTIVNEGSQTVNLGPPANWWKKNGVWSFSSPPHDLRILIIDPATGNMMMNRKCARVCYTGGDLNKHVPIRMSASLTLKSR